jgi:F-type H+-transporting ATPase subunit delta
MQNDALAQVYARSLFELARTAGGRAKIEEINDELEQLVELTRTGRRWASFLSSPVIDRARRESSLRQLFNGRITDLTLRFLMVLNRKGRLDRLESVAEAFDHLVQGEFGRVEVDVYTAAPLGDDAREFLAGRVQAAIGKEPVLHPYTDPRMIGGVKLRIGDRLIDGSVSTRLRRIKAAILSKGGTLFRDRIAGFIE